MNPVQPQRGPRPGDMTGLKKQALEAEHAAEAAEATGRISMTTKAEDERKAHEVIDYTGADAPLPEPERHEDTAEPLVTFRASQQIERMVFGREVREEHGKDEDGNDVTVLVPGNLRFFDFEEGRQYRVPRPLYEHLEERGYVAARY
jgi:hypothetical protein